jgi:ADP-heptose:LPS heptosyltransferase
VRVGILKPDHLGDLVLAAPAITALRRRFPDLTLFCHPKNLDLAAELYPGLPARPLLLPHLDKDLMPDTEARARVRLLREAADLLICLRWDDYVERLLDRLNIEFQAPGPVPHDLHVAVEHHGTVSPFTGPYDILSSYTYGGCGTPREHTASVMAVGLCISAGFRLNSWPLCHWLELAERLSRRGLRIVLIGGPAEMTRLEVLAGRLADCLGERPEMVVGSSDFRTTLRRLHDAVDLIVATDSGTAHLAALVRPVVSLFGGSPWQRFAPLGRHNAILTRRYPCSPCIQFSRAAVNTCHTQECLANLFPRQVEACLEVYLSGRELAEGVEIEGVWLTQAPWAGETRVAA